MSDRDGRDDAARGAADDPDNHALYADDVARAERAELRRHDADHQFNTVAGTKHRRRPPVD
jgi:hypothetical protein